MFVLSNKQYLGLRIISESVVSEIPASVFLNFVFPIDKVKRNYIHSERYMTFKDLFEVAEYVLPPQKAPKLTPMMLRQLREVFRT